MTVDADLVEVDLRQPSAPSPSGARGGSGPRPARVRRRPREFTSTDSITLIASVLSAVCLNWLMFERLLDGAGWFAFLVCSYVAFLVIFFVATADRLGRLVAVDRVVTVIVVTLSIAVMVPLALLVGYVFVVGIRALRVSFFLRDQGGVTPLMPSTAGGGSHAVMGTLQQVALALLWSLPLGVAAAVFLNESRSKWRRPVRIFVDAMSGLPSIVAGLFIFATLILPYAKSENSLFGYNGLMASLALAVTMLPTITRTVEVVLRLVPDGLREASLALGASRARTVWSVVFPTARTGMTTAVVLGIARTVGETAPLLFTAFGFDLMNSNPVGGPQESLPLFIFRNVRKPDQSAIDRGFAGALVLLLVVLSLFAVARFVGRDRSKRRNSRQARQAAPTISEPQEPSRP